ncbi:MAG TPA: TRAM domain-containing protein [Chloroflexota bacterium]|nr:TRAM domain-containing protein [Chloroflexota bacterium]
MPLRRLWVTTRSADAADLIGATAGLVVGLLIAALAAFPISLLPDPLGRWLPTVVALFLAWLGLAIGTLRKDEVASALRSTWAGGQLDSGLRGSALLDTSAIVDGRIVEIRRCGFIASDLAVPRFVLEEIQLLADSADPARRARGRRGLEMLEHLQRDFTLKLPDSDFPDLRGVDSKLIRLAKTRRAAIVTTDYNLNRIAGLQGVPVLNINDLAQALRSVVTVGEELALEIVQEGRERSQGVGYLDDGTMVVVEGTRHLVGQKAEVEVTRILPTAGGRMVFGRLKHPAPDRDVGTPERGGLRVLRPISGSEGE